MPLKALNNPIDNNLKLQFSFVGKSWKYNDDWRNNDAKLKKRKDNVVKWKKDKEKLKENFVRKRKEEEEKIFSVESKRRRQRKNNSRMIGQVKIIFCQKLVMM